MTPRQRAAFIESSLVIWDLLASYGNEEAGELAKALRTHGADLDDELVIRAVDKVLRVSALELATMGHTLRTAVAMGSDYAAAFTSVQADAARAGRTQKADQKALRAQLLKADHLPAATIGLRMAREDGRDHPYDASQVRRWLRRTVENRTD